MGYIIFCSFFSYQPARKMGSLARKYNKGQVKKEQHGLHNISFPFLLAFPFFQPLPEYRIHFRVVFPVVLDILDRQDAIEQLILSSPFV